MTPTLHLLLLPLLLSVACGQGLKDKKGPLENKALDVPEQTAVPYPIYQFQVSDPDVTGFQLTGEGHEDIQIAEDGWLYLAEPLDWARNSHYIIGVEALVGSDVVEGPAFVTISVLDINNHAPTFEQSAYAATVRERTRHGVPFVRVSASDLDDPESPNARLHFSLVSQIPNRNKTPFFQIDPVTGDISITEDGERMLKARESLQYGMGESFSSANLKKKFDDYCTPTQDIPHELNPFYTCLERAESRTRGGDRQEDPDYTLIVRVEDLAGASENALSGITSVKVVVEQNLWVNPGPLTVREHLKAQYPMVIAKVGANQPNASYRLLQKEREALRFPFSITDEGEVLLNEELDREEKDMYILVVMAEDHHGDEVESPMEIQVVVEDINDNSPECGSEEIVFEIQENEPVGSEVGQLVASDRDEKGTSNAMLMYTIKTVLPVNGAFSLDAVSGRILTRDMLRRRDSTQYTLTVNVSDQVFSTMCKVLIKVIDVNNELPLFEKNNYGSLSLAEDSSVGQTVLTVKASDADEAGSGSSEILFEITGNHGDTFAVETDGNGEGRLVIVKPLDFEAFPTYTLRINARNPEPLMAGLDYDSKSSASVFISVMDVDEDPEFQSSAPSSVSVPEDLPVGELLFTADAKDPEGKDISFKMEGDVNGWLVLDAATGAVKTKAKLDRETLEVLELTITAFEQGNPKKATERVYTVRLLDVNDNHPKLKESQAFICTKGPQPVVLRAVDPDSFPFSEPFTFSFPKGKKSPNWEITTVDGSSALLKMKKAPAEDKTFSIPISIIDNQGVGVTQKFEVKVCNCTALGYCYVAPGIHSFKYGMGTTVGILAGTMAFICIAFAIVVHRINKSNEEKKKAAAAGSGDSEQML
ncbi:cadherin-17 [Gadus macrocephalus]|uniref:cadherin-17 n=1 Tax=Gadus macrocephalus TaxID=80720 RepID=UPI0028CB2C91|nr:cadherin-17 [Gadus macrocephalus]XP_059922014.1 cadherin-17 [Gadus macrocephalus]